MSYAASYKASHLGFPMGFLRIWHRHFLGVELVASILVTAIALFLVHRYDWQPSILEWLAGVRPAFYTAIAAAAGAILGFSLAGVTITLALFENAKLDRVRKSKHYGKVYKTYFSAIRYLAITVLLSLVALLLDKDTSPAPIVILALFWSLVISALRVGRCAWILERITDIVTTPSDPF